MLVLDGVGVSVVVVVVTHPGLTANDIPSLEKSDSPRGD